MVFENILGYDNTMFWIHTMEIPYFIYPRILDIYYNYHNLEIYHGIPYSKFK